MNATKRPLSPTLSLLLLAAVVFGSMMMPLSALIPGHPCVVDEAPLKGAASSMDWRGEWETNWGDLTICVLGERFEGQYGDGHIIAGPINPINPINPTKPHVLAGRWVHDGEVRTGRMTFTMTEDGTFIGAWSWGDKDPSADPAGVWTGQLAMLKKPAGELKIKEVQDEDEAGKPLKGEAAGKALQADGQNGGQDGPVRQTFKLTNTTAKTVYVYGHSKDSPFIQPSTLNPETGEWEEKFIGYCGTGARRFDIAPGENFTATVSLDQKLAGREIAIGLTLYMDPAGKTHRKVRVSGLRAQL